LAAANFRSFALKGNSMSSSIVLALGALSVAGPAMVVTAAALGLLGAAAVALCLLPCRNHHTGPTTTLVRLWPQGLRWIVLFAMLSALVGLWVPASATASTSARSRVLLIRGAGYDRPHGSDRVRALQRHLRAAGVNIGPVDGRFGPLTEAAVRRFQSTQGLAVDGIVGPRTTPALHKPIRLAPGMGGELPQGAQRVRALQRHLRTLGVHPGPVDGRYGPQTAAAVRRYQRTRGLATDGIVGARTARRLAHQTKAAADQTATQPPRRGTAPPPARKTPTTQPAPRRTPIAANPPSKPTRAHGGSDPFELAVVIGLVALAATLLAATVASRHRRRTRRPMPTEEIAPATAAARPAPAPAATPAPRPQPRAAVKRAPAARPVSIPHNGSGASRPPTVLAPPGPPGAAGPSGASRAATVPGAPSPTASPGASREPTRPGSPGPGGSRRVRVLGYVSVPPGSGLEAGSGPQGQAIEAACAARGWAFVGGVRELEPTNGKGLDRPGLTHALARLERGEADCLMVTELARLTRSAAELGQVLDRLARTRARLVVLDPEIDTATDSGQLAARALTTVSGWEHQRLAERTRKGLQAARARGATGRPAVSDHPQLVEQITTMRANGMTLQAIADTLNNQGQPTIRGGTQWRPSSVQAALGYKRRPRTPGSDNKANGREGRTDTEATGRDRRRDD
jgi:peptidoglycan hydrolase-like protein with peptidoglycan-binding domain/DNA invertase Pin-like site-specific DNA recombinase